MKAPEEIYLYGYDFDPEPCVRWEREPIERRMRGHKAQNICYIRKDIVDETTKTAEDHAYFAGKEKLREELLEWLKMVNADPMIPMNIDRVIDKVKSM